MSRLKVNEKTELPDYLEVPIHNVTIKIERQINRINNPCSEEIERFS